MQKPPLTESQDDGQNLHQLNGIAVSVITLPSARSKSVAVFLPGKYKKLPTRH